MTGWEIGTHFIPNVDVREIVRAQATMCKYPESQAIWVISPGIGHVLFQTDMSGIVESSPYISENEEDARQIFLYWAFNI